MNKIILFSLFFFFCNMFIESQNLIKSSFYGCEIGNTTHQQAIERLNFFGFGKESLLIDKNDILVKNPNIQLEGLMVQTLLFIFEKDVLTKVVAQNDYSLSKNEGALGDFNTFHNRITDYLGKENKSIRRGRGKELSWGENGPIKMSLNLFYYTGLKEITGEDDFISVQLCYELIHNYRISHKSKIVKFADNEIGKTNIVRFYENIRNTDYITIPDTEDSSLLYVYNSYDPLYLFFDGIKYDFGAVRFEVLVLNELNLYKRFSKDNPRESVSFYVDVSNQLDNKYGKSDERITNSNYKGFTEYWGLNDDDRIVIELSYKFLKDDDGSLYPAVLCRYFKRPY